jgi:hypothetical protein
MKADFWILLGGMKVFGVESGLRKKVANMYE